MWRALILLLITFVVYVNFSMSEDAFQGSRHSSHIRIGEKSVRLLVTIPIKATNERRNKRMISNLCRLSFPLHEEIDISFLVDKESDALLRPLIPLMISCDYLASKIKIELDPFEVENKKSFVEMEDNSAFRRHDLSIQLQRRVMIAKARNYLLDTSLKKYHTHVLHIDSDLQSYETDIVEKLLKIDTDIVVPMCFSSSNEKLYDLNSWAETPESLRILKKTPSNVPLFEGYGSSSGRKNVYKLMQEKEQTGENGPGEKIATVSLDAVGGTMILVKAKVHRALGSVNFPLQLTSHHSVETEGFAQLAKGKRFEVLGANYKIYHA